MTVLTCAGAADTHCLEPVLDVYVVTFCGTTFELKRELNCRYYSWRFGFDHDAGLWMGHVVIERRPVRWSTEKVPRHQFTLRLSSGWGDVAGAVGETPQEAATHLEPKVATLRAFYQGWEWRCRT